MDLSIIIVNYRSAAMTVDCLRSLSTQVNQPVRFDVTVVDNASGDDSVATLTRCITAERWGGWARVLPAGRNGGFAFGNNAAIAQVLARPDAPPLVLLLNPDTIVRDGALATLVHFMNTHAQVGIAGSRLEDPDGTPQTSAFRFPTVLSELEAGLRLGVATRLLSRWQGAPPPSDLPHRTDWVAGASMIIRREVFDAIGLMDERFFMYYEEVDFCLRAQRAGFQCWYVPQSRVVHLVGQCSGVTDTRRKPSRRPDYWFESRKRFFVKNHGAIVSMLADAAFALGYASFRVRRALQRKPDTDPPCLLWDTIRHSVICRGTSIRGT